MLRLRGAGLGGSLKRSRLRNRGGCGCVIAISSELLSFIYLQATEKKFYVVLEIEVWSLGERLEGDTYVGAIGR